MPLIFQVTVAGYGHITIAQNTEDSCLTNIFGPAEIRECQTNCDKVNKDPWAQKVRCDIQIARVKE